MGFANVLLSPRALVPILVAGGLAGVGMAAAPARSVQSAQGPAGPSDASSQVASLLQGQVPIIAQHRYRIAGKIRPLLFWMGRDNIGGARVNWRRGEGADTGYDLLIGSDPARTPRSINRWGFIMEESFGGTTSVLGVMKKGQEDTIEEAKKNLAAEAGSGIMFDMIRATVGPAESVSRVTSTRVGRDYSYRELTSLMENLVRETAPPTVRTVAVPAGGRHGLLLSVAELLHDGVETVRKTSRAPARKSLPYAYYHKQYDLTRVSSSIEKQEEYEGVKYPRLLESDFEIRARGETWVERFTIVCGVDGAVAEIPVFMTYQPRWWFRLELVLDERQAF
jgi:hypothetical protein